MKTIPLGSTGLRVTKTAMGCLPLQRCGTDYAVRLLRHGLRRAAAARRL